MNIQKSGPYDIKWKQEQKMLIFSFIFLDLTKWIYEYMKNKTLMHYKILW